MSTSDSITPLFKKCSKCGRELAATTEFFYALSRLKSGLTSACKRCSAEYGKLYRATHRDECLIRCRASRLAHHEARLEYERRRREKHSVDVRSCAVAWRKGNPGKILANNRNRRALLRGNGGTHTNEDIQSQYDQQKGKCYWCHQRLDSYHVDHVVPIALGGSNGPENLVVACPACNLAKGSRHPMDFAGRML